MGLRSMVDGIYNEDCFSLLHTNYKRSGPFREEVFFYVFPILSLLGRGHLSPQGNEWQDLCILNYNIAAYKTYKLWVLWFQRRRFSHFKPMADTHTPGVVCTNPRGTVGRICKEGHYTYLHIKCKCSGPCVSEKIFYVFCHSIVRLR